MSAPDPLKWDVTTEESEELRDGTFRTQERIVHAIARRRALAELKALLPEFCSGCKAGLPPVDHPWKVNKPEWFPGLYHNREEVGMIECECPEIHDRIAAIESEEA